MSKDLFALDFPEYDQVLKQGSKHAGEILAMTCFIIVLNVFFMGSMAPWFLKYMKVVPPPPPILMEEIPYHPHYDDDSNNSEEEEENTINHSGLGMVQYFHKNYMLPFFSPTTTITTTTTTPTMLATDTTRTNGELSTTPFNLREQDGFVLIDHHDDLLLVKSRMSLNQMDKVLATNTETPPLSASSGATTRATPPVLRLASQERLNSANNDPLLTREEA
jgi:hypothetical protein